MSIPVDLSKLAEAMARYRFAYLLTAGERGAPHAVDGEAVVAGDGLRITPARAVLPRPAPSREPAAPGACGSDCVEIA